MKYVKLNFVGDVFFVRKTAHSVFTNFSRETKRWNWLLQVETRPAGFFFELRRRVRAPVLSVLHSGSKCQKATKNKSTQGDFTSFSMEVCANSHNFRFRLYALHIQNLSNRCRHKYDSSQRRRIVQKDGGASSNMGGIICSPWARAPPPPASL